jgi:hypothetical protein
MFDTADPETFWLNVTNLALGLVTLAALLALGYAIGREVIERVRARATVPATEDAHSFLHPELGLTMADGGEPLKKEKGNETKSH